MEQIGWAFPPKGTGNEQGYTNGGIESFKGKKLIENLAREICQNSLDAHNPTSGSPVHVKFQLRSISQTKHQMFAEYRECIERCKQNWAGRMDARLERFINGAEKMLQQSNVPVLVASDINTTGLTGVNAGENEDSAWRALAHADGTSVAKTSDSAGSYGIGKNAPFACTALSMVFYNTLAIDGGCAFQGVSRMASIVLPNGRKTQGVGHYLCTDTDPRLPDYSRPINAGDNCSFFEEFKRDQYGTDIIVVGFNIEHDWKDQMIIALAANFFDAFHRGKLVVEIEDVIIDAGELPKIMDKYFKESSVAEHRGVYEWYQALTSPENGEPIYLTILEENDVAIYIRYEDGYKNRVAFFRKSGMKTRTTRPGSFQPYAAVVEVKETAINALLRETEPVQHDKWDHKLITDDAAKRKKAKGCIEKIDNAIRDILKARNEAEGEQSQDSGEGDYLPDEEDVNISQQGDDILRVRQKLGAKRSVSDPSSEFSQTKAAPGKGTKVTGDTFGKKKRRKKTKGKTVVDGDGDIPGMKPSNSGKPMSTIRLNLKKAYILNEKIGLYKVIVQPNRDTQNLYLTFTAVGEDQSEEDLRVNSFSVNGVTKKQSNMKMIGPISLVANKPTEVFVTFEDKEKMMLNISEMEVIGSAK